MNYYTHIIPLPTHSSRHHSCWTLYFKSHVVIHHSSSYLFILSSIQNQESFYMSFTSSLKLNSSLSALPQHRGFRFYLGIFYGYVFLFLAVFLYFSNLSSWQIILSIFILNDYLQSWLIIFTCKNQCFYLL